MEYTQVAKTHLHELEQVRAKIEDAVSSVQMGGDGKVAEDAKAVMDVALPLVSGFHTDKDAAEALMGVYMKSDGGATTKRRKRA